MTDTMTLRLTIPIGPDYKMWEWEEIVKTEPLWALTLHLLHLIYTMPMLEVAKLKCTEADTLSPGMASDHKCALCSQGFPSGAALGGHVSQHNLCETIESKGELKAGILNFDKKKNKCGVCGRHFRSANSLLLHMDSHKEGDVRSSTENEYLPSSSRVMSDIRTALDYLRQLFGCSSSSAGRDVEEEDIAVKVKPEEELGGRGQERFTCKSLGKRKRSENGATGRVLFVPHFDLNEFPPPEQFCPNEWSNRDG